MKCCLSTDVGTLTNWLTFEPDPDHSQDARTGLFSPISYKRCYAEFYVGKIPRIRIGGPSLQRRLVLQWFYALQGRSQEFILTEARGLMASAGTRAYNGGLGAEPPAGSRGRTPGQGVRGAKPPPWSWTPLSFAAPIGFKMVLFSRRNISVGGTCALPSALLHCHKV